MNVPKLRFKEFTDEWKTHKLKDFFSKITKKISLIQFIMLFPTLLNLD